MDNWYTLYSAIPNLVALHSFLNKAQKYPQISQTSHKKKNQKNKENTKRVFLEKIQRVALLSRPPPYFSGCKMTSLSPNQVH